MIFRYPIYHIPMGRNIRDLSTCFLTFHTLSSSFQGILWSIYLTFCLYSLSFSPILTFAFAQIGFTCKYMTTHPYVPIGDRSGPWKWLGGCWKEEANARGGNLTVTIWLGHLQDARRRLGVPQQWKGPGEAGVAFERGRFVAKAAEGPPPWLRLLRGVPSWMKMTPN